jgi:hypothetical protein
MNWLEHFFKTLGYTNKEYGCFLFRNNALVTILNVHETFFDFLSLIWDFHLFVFSYTFLFLFFDLFLLFFFASRVRSLSLSPARCLVGWLHPPCWMIGVWIPPRLMLHYGEWGGDSPVWWVPLFFCFFSLLRSFYTFLINCIRLWRR